MLHTVALTKRPPSCNPNAAATAASATPAFGDGCAGASRLTTRATSRACDGRTKATAAANNLTGQAPRRDTERPSDGHTGSCVGHTGTTTIARSDGLEAGAGTRKPRLPGADGEPAG